MTSTEAAAVSSRKLDLLPVRDGFRLRGLEMTRIETFTDAAFAFALTLLVLSGTPPTSLAELKYIIRDIPAFLFGAGNLMVFWSGHNEWSRRFGLDDGLTKWLSGALVCAVLIYVYPLRYVGSLVSSLAARLTHLPLGHPQGPDFQISDVNTGFLIYAVGFIACAVVIILLNLHSWRLRDELKLNDIEKQATIAELGAWGILCGVGVISAIIALLYPDRPGLPGYAYMLLMFIMPLYGRSMDKRRKRALEGTPSHSDVLGALGAKDSTR